MLRPHRLANSPGSRQHLTDTWAFSISNDKSKVVLMMRARVSSYRESISVCIFDHNIRYRFEIENTGDARPDRFVDVTYSRGSPDESDGYYPAA